MVDLYKLNVKVSVKLNSSIWKSDIFGIFIILFWFCKQKVITEVVLQK